MDAAASGRRGYGGRRPWTDRFAAERALGSRTGELHVALGAVQDPGLHRRRPMSGHRRRRAAHTRRDRRAILLLQEQRMHLPDFLASRLP